MLKRIREMIFPYRKQFIFVFFLMLLTSILEGIQFPTLIPLLDRVFNDGEIVFDRKVPIYIENIINILNQMPKQVLFIRLIVFVSCVMVIRNILVYVYEYLTYRISKSIMRDMRNKIYQKVQQLSLTYFNQERTGELISRIINDVNNIEGLLSQTLISSVRQVTLLMIYIGILFTIYPKVTIIIFLMFPIFIYPMIRIKKFIKKFSKQEQEGLADINVSLIESISGIQTIKAFNTEEKEFNKFQEYNKVFYKSIMKGLKKSLLISPLTEIVGTIFAVVVLFLIGNKVMNGQVSTGFFIVYLTTVLSLIRPIKLINNLQGIIQRSKVSLDRIYEILDEEICIREKEDAKTIKTFNKNIVLKDVYFKYDEEGKQILSKINMTINKGEMVSIVGLTGSGKTTLVNLLPRFYEVNSGEILIDDKNIKDLKFQSLRELFSIVSQEIFLFNDTIKNNIIYGQKQKISDKEIKDIARKSYADKFIDKMPQKYESIIGERGTLLSGGEKQRISIARAIIRSSPILILDEATSHLDTISEEYIQEALDKHMKGQTIIAIAHRLSTIKQSDKIFVLDKGEIIAEGKHSDLIKTNELYKTMCQKQFSK